jgi:hypothetical protein
MMPARATKSRWASRPLDDQPASMPPYNHPALTEGRTLYPKTVRTPGDRWALKSATNTAKIGGEILKGKWRGFAAYTLSLEERRTCPKSCEHWRSCMGNKMHWSERMQAGPNLEWRLEREIALLDIEHPRGFCVRLHVLGDFYSIEYVELWARLLEQHPALHIWGYSARHDKDDPIAAALVALVERQWGRFAMRFSNAPVPFATPATITVEHPFQVPDDGTILCPEQVGKTESCSTCGLCWQSRRRLAFLQH